MLLRWLALQMRGIARAVESDRRTQHCYRHNRDITRRLSMEALEDRLALATGVVPQDHPEIQAAIGAPVTIIKGPYLQQPTPTSIVIMWETDVAAGSRVDYGGSFVEDPTPVTIHEIPITGLTADTTYNYTVTSGDANSPQSTFATAPAVDRSFRFAACGDSRSQPSEYSAVIQGIINTPGGGPELMFHTGDLVGSGRDYSQWEPEFFTPAHDLMVDTPMIPTLGNHEYVGTGYMWYFDFFSLPNNEEWYAFTYSNVRFIALNSYVDYFPGSSQYNWLVSELQSTEYNAADWQIVYFHDPAFSSGYHGGTSRVQNNLVPLPAAMRGAPAASHPPPLGRGPPPRHPLHRPARYGLPGGSVPVPLGHVLVVRLPGG